MARPFQPGEDLRVDGWGLHPRAAGRIQRIVEALDPVAVDRAFAVLRRREPAPGLEHRGDPVRDTLGDVDPAGQRVGREQLRVVVEHALVVRLAPVAHGRVAEESAVDAIAQTQGGLERAGRERGGRGIPHRGSLQQEALHRRHGELRGSSKAAKLDVLVGLEFGDDRPKVDHERAAAERG